MGKLFSDREERIISLRGIPLKYQDNRITGTFDYGIHSYKKKAFEKVIDESDNQKIVLSQVTESLATAGISVSEIDLVGIANPPISNIKTADIVVRIDRNDQNLEVHNVNPVQNFQRIEFVNRDRVRNSS